MNVKQTTALISSMFDNIETKIMSTFRVVMETYAFVNMLCRDKLLTVVICYKTRRYWNCLEIMRYAIFRSIENIFHSVSKSCKSYTTYNFTLQLMKVILFLWNLKPSHLQHIWSKPVYYKRLQTMDSFTFIVFRVGGNYR